MTCVSQFDKQWGDPSVIELELQLFINVYESVEVFE